MRKISIARIRASSEKVIAQTLTLTAVLATSENQAQTWKSTIDTPPTDWFRVGFNDSAWKSGPGGFGGRTPWNTKDIWLRQEFNAGELTADDRNSLVFSCFHDEDCEIYINGVLAARAPTTTTTYVAISMGEQARRAIVPNGKNVMAVHCLQRDGGQFIDADIYKMKISGETQSARSMRRQ